MKIRCILLLLLIPNCFVYCQVILTINNKGNLTHEITYQFPSTGTQLDLDNQRENITISVGKDENKSLQFSIARLTPFNIQNTKILLEPGDSISLNLLDVGVSPKDVRLEILSKYPGNILWYPHFSQLYKTYQASKLSENPDTLFMNAKSFFADMQVELQKFSEAQTFSFQALNMLKNELNYCYLSDLITIGWATKNMDNTGFFPKQLFSPDLFNDSLALFNSAYYRMALIRYYEDESHLFRNGVNYWEKSLYLKGNEARLDSVYKAHFNRVQDFPDRLTRDFLYAHNVDYIYVMKNQLNLPVENLLQYVDSAISFIVDERIKMIAIEKKEKKLKFVPLIPN